MLPRRLPGTTILPPGDGVLQRELSRLQELSAQSLPAYLEDLATLVGTDCGSYSKPGVDRVGRSTVRFLERLGATVTVHPNVDLGDTVVGTIEGTPGGPRLLLIGHLDTVFPDGTAAGRPSLAGPGPIGGNDHAPTEYLELDSIVPRTTLLTAMMLATGRDGEVASWRPSGT